MDLPPDDYRAQVEAMHRELRLLEAAGKRLETYPEFDEAEWSEALGHIADAELYVAMIVRGLK